MSSLIIVRHGQSAWNLENRFTGETDVELTPQGEAEAHKAGKVLKKFPIDKAFTSVLVRAIHTLKIILEETGHPNIPIAQSSALNERNYGDLQGLNKKETEEKYGVEQVLQWRRSYEVRPPAGESLHDTYNRVIPYYKEKIEPELQSGRNILIVAHGNSLRALMMLLENIDDKNISNVDLPTGLPRKYDFESDMKLKRVYNVQ